MFNLLQGDSLQVLKTLPDRSINMCVTSPPYYGLRDYGNDGQIGLEQTPDEYVAKLVAVFREVKRVLRDDGTLWLNLGDSYAANQSNNGGYSDKSPLAGFTNSNTKGRQSNENNNPRKIKHGLKPKDLIGIPWRVAFALQADVWYLRQDIIWHKPNPMPESVRDRCTKSHEYLFLLSKSKKYYYDHEAIKEPEVMKPQRRLTPRKANTNAKVHGMPVYRQAEGGVGGGMRNKRSVWSITTKPFKGAHFAVMPEALVEPCILAGSPENGTVIDPFAGASTVGVVAIKHNRKFVGIELNPDYIKISEDRINKLYPEIFKKQV